LLVYSFNRGFAGESCCDRDWIKRKDANKNGFPATGNIYQTRAGQQPSQTLSEEFKKQAEGRRKKRRERDERSRGNLPAQSL